MHHHYFLLLQPKIEVKLNIKTSFLPQVDTSFTHYYEASHLVTLGQIFYSRGRPLENSRGRPVDFTGRPVNSTGRPLEFSRGRPLEQKIWPNIFISSSQIEYTAIIKASMVV